MPVSVSDTIVGYKTADEAVTSSTTLQDDAHMFFNTLGDTSETCFCVKMFINTAGIGGIKIGLNGTATVTALRAMVQVYDGTTGQLVTTGRLNAFGESVSASLGVGDAYAEIQGAIEASTGGSLIVRWAQSVSSSGATTVQRGSRIEILPVG